MYLAWICVVMAFSLLFTEIFVSKGKHPLVYCLSLKQSGMTKE